MRDVIVFVGPSLGHAEAEQTAPFTYRPPASQGDVLRAALDGVRIIGLVDGYFEGVPAVWHKEILFALDRGIHVFGAASMGALRAAELASYGMRGIGRIFEWYATRSIDADDEVALVHGPAEMGFPTLSEPMVNVRATLERGVAEGVIATVTADRLLQGARRLFYKTRTWPRILAEGGLPTAEAVALAAWVAENGVDQKRLDARALLDAIAVFRASSPGPFRAKFAFEPTDAWLIGVGTLKSDSALSDMDLLVLDEARLDPRRFERLSEAVAPRVLSPGTSPGQQAERREGSRRLDRFRSENGLQDRTRFAEWLAANELDPRALDELLAARESVAGRLVDSRDQLIPAVMAEIKLRGLYPALAERARKKKEELGSRYGRLAGSGPPSPPLHLLLEWFYERRCDEAVPDDLDAICRRLALPDRSALQVLLAREFLFDTLSS